ncbi:hypothetical protein MNBD_GAMMA11-3171 [hydrothermal vent metagenome]|uniref:SCP2 domain-containing protein n=1 Tax=hydrothermal vent metagenome TaxID=652676 RepID=A0A3B0WXS8_9ZZZZ
MNQTYEFEKSPCLPSGVSAPLKRVPEKLHLQLLIVFLNKLLKNQLKEGDLEFLEQKMLFIKVSDINITYAISLKNKRLIAASTESDSDLRVEASLYDFLTLVARHVDSDTLVFQRRLLMQGNTELGLELKNFLDGLDIESTGAFTIIELLLKKSLPVYRYLFSRDSGR